MARSRSWARPLWGFGTAAVSAVLFLTFQRRLRVEGEPFAQPSTVAPGETSIIGWNVANGGFLSSEVVRFTVTTISGPTGATLPQPVISPPINLPPSSHVSLAHNWTAPATQGQYTIECRVVLLDPEGEKLLATGTVVVTVSSNISSLPGSTAPASPVAAGSPMQGRATRAPTVRRARTTSRTVIGQTTRR